VVRAAQGDDEGARKAYLEGARWSPGDATMMVDLGNLERRGHRFDEALAAYRGALQRDSTQVLARRGEIEVLRDMGRNEDAGRAYRRWLAREPANTGVRVAAMDFFGSIGRKDVALELAREGVRVSPNSAEAHLALGMALHEAGADRTALPQLRRAEDLFIRAESSARVGALIRAMRAQAPDSLRAFFAADSVKNEAGRPVVPVDSVRVAPRR
jgi:tetratricopeptide (TPR) repeat protein